MYIIGVTSCSTGIAHTYMAAEAIKKAAKKLGHTSKVETQGSIGIENKLSKKDIDTADLIIICADAALREPDRFTGKKLYEKPTEVFIKNADRAMKDAIDSLNL